MIATNHKPIGRLDTYLFRIALEYVLLVGMHYKSMLFIRREAELLE